MNWLTGKGNESKKWIAQLSDSNKRAAAANELIRLGPAAVDGLLEALVGKDLNMRSTAGQMLVKLGPVAVPRLSEVLASAHPETRQLVADVLGEMRHPSAVPPLVKAASGEFFTVRARAATALGKVGDPQTLPLLIELLRDKEIVTRIAAAFAVVKFNDPRWLVPLSDMLLEDPEIEVRAAAAKAMAESHNKAVIPYLIEALQDSFWWYERDESETAPLIQSVASYGPEAVPALIEALRHPEGAARQNAVDVLALIGDPRSIEPLSLALYDVHFEVGQSAGLALTRFGAACLDILEEATRASDTSIRMHAINALGYVKDPRAFALLASMLRDPNRDIVKQVIASLVNSRDRRAVQILQPLAADRSDRELSIWVREALSTLEQNLQK